MYLCIPLQVFRPRVSPKFIEWKGEKSNCCGYQFFKQSLVQVKHIFLKISPDLLRGAEPGNDLSEGRRSTISQDSVFVFGADCRGWTENAILPAGATHTRWLRDSVSLKLRLLPWENGVFRVTMINIGLNGGEEICKWRVCWSLCEGGGVLTILMRMINMRQCFNTQHSRPGPWVRLRRPVTPGRAVKR